MAKFSHEVMYIKNIVGHILYLFSPQKDYLIHLLPFTDSFCTCLCNWRSLQRIAQFTGRQQKEHRGFLWWSRSGGKDLPLSYWVLGHTVLLVSSEYCHSQHADICVEKENWKRLTISTQQSLIHQSEVIWMRLLPPTFEVWQKVMFSQVSVCPRGWGRTPWCLVLWSLVLSWRGGDTPVRSVAGGRGNDRIGDTPPKVDRLCRERYASCGHAGGLSCSNCGTVWIPGTSFGCFLFSLILHLLFIVHMCFTYK